PGVPRRRRQQPRHAGRQTADAGVRERALRVVTAVGTGSLPVPSSPGDGREGYSLAGTGKLPVPASRAGKGDKVGEQPDSGELRRHFGVTQATALNVAMIVGAGVFITIPFMLKELPGPAALLGWLAAGALILVDGLIWSELGAALPGSGGSYTYLLECYGPSTWGRLMAFLFIWQFLLSGPL